MTFKIDISEYNKLSGVKRSTVQIVQGTNLGFSMIAKTTKELTDALAETKEIAKNSVLKTGDKMQGDLGVLTLSGPKGNIINSYISEDEYGITWGNKDQYSVIACEDFSLELFDGENFAKVFTEANPPSARDVGTLSKQEIEDGLDLKASLYDLDERVSKSGDAMRGGLSFRVDGEAIQLLPNDRTAASYISSTPGFFRSWSLGKTLANNDDVQFSNSRHQTTLTLASSSIVSTKELYVLDKKVWHEGNLTPVDKSYVDLQLSNKVDQDYVDRKVVGTVSQPIKLTSEDLNSVLIAGVYTQDGSYVSSSRSYPAGADGAAGALTVYTPSSDYIIQKWVPHLKGGLEYSRSRSNGSWSEWGSSFNSVNPPSLVDLGALGHTGNQTINGDLKVNKLSVANYDASNQLILELGANNHYLKFAFNGTVTDGLDFSNGRVDVKQPLTFLSSTSIGIGGKSGFYLATDFYNTNWGIQQRGDKSFVISKFTNNSSSKDCLTIDKDGFKTTFGGPVYANTFFAKLAQEDIPTALTRKDYVDGLIAELKARIAALEAKP